MPSRKANGTLVFKVVFWGGEGSGRSTALRWIHESLGLADESIKNSKFDSGVRYYERIVTKVSNVSFHVYLISALKHQKLIRKMVLKGTDAIVFIWDTLKEKWEENVESFKELVKLFGHKIKNNSDPKYNIPIVVCANKRDLEDIIEVSKIRDFMDENGLEKSLIFETIAINGTNIKKAFAYVCREAVLNHYKILKGDYDYAEEKVDSDEIKQVTEEISGEEELLPELSKEERKKLKLKVVEDFLEGLGINGEDYNKEEILEKLGLDLSKDTKKDIEMVDIFVSYAVADSKRLNVKGITETLEIKEYIEKVHYWEGWTGYPDGNIIRFMEKNLTKSQIFIAICTQCSIESMNCEKERDMAYFQNKRIIPLFEDFNCVPPIFQPYKGVNIKNKDPDEIADEIYKMLFP
ncbi:MAG: TIR domain-containing protein [Candidatus Lokiarchaeota archaeon]|nr:TIR domain-containing protein [Candidatus Lokiarchaeota archaeon]